MMLSPLRAAQSPSSSTPPSLTDPPTTVAARGRMSKIVLPIIVLPAPLSPTSAAHLAGRDAEADAAQQPLAGCCRSAIERSLISR